MIPLIGAFIIAPSPDTILEKISLIPFQAFSQSPVNTPTMKSINPPKASHIPPKTSDIIPNAVINKFPIVSKIGDKTGTTFSTIQLISGTSHVFHISLIPLINLPINSKNLSTIG